MNLDIEGTDISLLEDLSPAAISVDLTEAGLLVQRTEAIAQLYAKHLDWSVAKEEWHTHRVSGRGSRHSAQKVFRVIRGRLQAPGNVLPNVPQLSRILKACYHERSKAQIIYLYLLEADGLVRFLLSEILDQKGDGLAWNLSPDRLAGMLERFRYPDGDPLQYAESTLHRWVQGLRSVFREIGVLESPRDREGTTPMLEDVPLLVSAGYSWKKQKEGWQRHPIGWTYLFQSSHHQRSLLERLASNPGWTMRQQRDRTMLVPTDSDTVFDFS